MQGGNLAGEPIGVAHIQGLVDGQAIAVLIDDVDASQDTEAVESVFEAVGGVAGLRRLAAAWHERVMADEIVSHAFSHGFRPEHTERLAAHWAEALGGPALYSETMGNETAVFRTHSGNGPHEEMDERAIACFDEALNDVGFTADDPVRPCALRLFHLGDERTDGEISRLG